MLTFTEITRTERTLETPEEIADHIAAEFQRRQEAVPFHYGDKVRIVRRDGVPSQFLIGDVGIVLLCQDGFSPTTILLGKSEIGMTIQFPVPTANLEKIA